MEAPWQVKHLCAQDRQAALNPSSKYPSIHRHVSVCEFRALLYAELHAVQEEAVGSEQDAQL